MKLFKNKLQFAQIVEHIVPNFVIAANALIVVMLLLIALFLIDLRSRIVRIEIDSNYNSNYLLDIHLQRIEDKRLKNLLKNPDLLPEEIEPQPNAQHQAIKL